MPFKYYSIVCVDLYEDFLLCELFDTDECKLSIITLEKKLSSLRSNVSIECIET